MSLAMLFTLYLGLGLPLSLLRLQQGHAPADAGMAGLLWPFELLIAALDAVEGLAISRADT